MTPHYADDWLTVYHGDSPAVMAEMGPESVHCVVTSPPYWGLRDYGSPDQLGLEPTPEAYVESMVAVFREVRRVLRSDGTVWLNLGDSYNGSGKGGNGGESSGLKLGQRARDEADYRQGFHNAPTKIDGLKPKDLVGIPWRVAFALQADGWYLRSDIIWAKPNPMPESVTDRPTKSHEYLFLLSKSPRYYFDAAAVAETSIRAGDIPGGGGGYKGDGVNDGRTRAGMAFAVTQPVAATRNIRSVWTIATQPYPGAHFATFPPKLIEPCIKAGTSERGVCPECGGPWVREVERIGERQTHGVNNKVTGDEFRGPRQPSAAVGSVLRTGLVGVYETTGWRPTCRHMFSAMGTTTPATVLDPFAGSGTTGMVAQSLSRRAVLIDLSMDYLDQLLKRNRDIPLGLGA